MKNNDRRIEAKRFREDAASLAFNRDHPDHKANGDEQRFASVNYAMSFTKGLDHDMKTGLVCDKNHFEAFRRAVDNGVIEDFTLRVPVPRVQPRRQWEAPTAGLVFDLQGPDPQAVTMPAAPALGSDELAFEMAEVYELALLRDVPFNRFDSAGPAAEVTAAFGRLNKMDYIKKAKECCGFTGRPRKVDDEFKLDAQTVFRGSSPGVENGPYLSAFLLMGNSGFQTPQHGGNPREGFISYGAQVIDQRVPEAEEGDDYMVTFEDWLEVQQGYNVNRGLPDGTTANGTMSGQKFSGNRRFIHTPRDLATYVHFDALYQAYLNACLILLGGGTPFDPAFDNLSGQSNAKVLINAGNPTVSVDANAGGFALYGGPHILTLVTEVATRALKAVRYQKFNNHIRLRPEALAARLEKAADIEKAHRGACSYFSDAKKSLAATAKAVRDANKKRAPGNKDYDTILLPMAFAEGSPMHPAYGAGHATVAGACVTVLKAYFDTSALLIQSSDGFIGFQTEEQIEAREAAGETIEYVRIETDSGGEGLDVKTIAKGDCPLTLEGELNKVCANISIGRNMAGVHYFSDYYDSVRMGEEIAIGMLEEQAIGYPTDPFVMSLPTFDGAVERIGVR